MVDSRESNTRGLTVQLRRHARITWYSFEIACVERCRCRFIVQLSKSLAFKTFSDAIHQQIYNSYKEWIFRSKFLIFHVYVDVSTAKRVNCFYIPRIRIAHNRLFNKKIHASSVAFFYAGYFFHFITRMCYDWKYIYDLNGKKRKLDAAINILSLGWKSWIYLF